LFPLCSCEIGKLLIEKDFLIDFHFLTNAIIHDSATFVKRFGDCFAKGAFVMTRSLLLKPSIDALIAEQVVTFVQFAYTVKG